MRKSTGKSGAHMPLLTVLARDGFLFYAVIVGVNTVNLLIFLFTRKDIKPVGGAFCVALNLTMINRLQLNLRSPCITGRRAVQSCSYNPQGFVKGNCMRIKKACSCADEATSPPAFSTTGRLTTIRSFVISQPTPILDDSMSLSNRIDDTSGNNSYRGPKQPQSTLKKEYLRHLSRDTGAALNQISETETGGESIDSNLGPRWWFDRQVISLGGDCRIDDENEDIDEEELTSEDVRGCEHENCSNAIQQDSPRPRFERQCPLPTLDCNLAGSSSSGSRTDLSTPDWNRVPFDFTRPRLHLDSQITSEAIIEAPEQLELKNFKESR